MAYPVTVVSPKRTVLSALTVAALLLGSLAILAQPAGAASGFTAHAPILIDGNAGFTSANGVSGGNGTAADPYRIENWSIDASAADGIVVRNTTAWFAIVDVLVYSGGYAYDGVVLDNVSWALVENATLTHDASGVVVSTSANVSLVANAVLLNAWNGIDVQDCRDVFLNGNSVSYNRDGVAVQRSDRVRLVGNSVWMNTQDGAYLSDLTNASVVGGTFGSNRWSGIDLVGGANLTVYVNQIWSNGQLGLAVSSVVGVRVTSNAFSSNPGGAVQLGGVTNVTVEANTVSPAGYSGITIESAANVRIARNTVSQANYSGILLGGVTNATVVSNTLSSNDVGMGGVNVTSLVMRSNAVATSTERGVSIVGSRNLTFSGNNLSRNGNGFVLDSSSDAVIRANTLWQNGYGVYLFQSAGVLVVNNSFKDNAPQAYDDGSGRNQWDAGYPSGGNYWSDYQGIDLCSGVNQSLCIDPDGIGDTPYPVDGGAWDRYPLMRIPGSSVQSPVATFVIEPLQGNTTTLFVFNAASSYDQQDPSAALLLRWDLDGDGAWDTPWTTNRTVTHRYPQPGNYAVHLEVLDLSGLVSDKVLNLVVVVPRAPPPPPSLVPALVLLGLAAVVVAAVLYRRWQAKRPAPGDPAWRLPPGPRR